MMNNTIIQWAVAALFIGYTGYSTFKSIKLLMTHRQKLEEFQNRFPHAELFDRSKSGMSVAIVLCLLCVVLYFTTDRFGVAQDQLFYYKLAYISLGIVFVGLIFESYVRQRMWFTEEGLFFVDTYYRFRMITDYEIQKSLMKNVKIVWGNKGDFIVSAKMAQEIRAREKAWKEQRKKNKKK
ncbi:MAG: hypothetical protein J6D36_04940 [Erysipelotrichaceae bacterium]|nr:hypothetical protein [Erysipelotrichaceae bacterium]